MLYLASLLIPMTRLLGM